MSIGFDKLGKYKSIEWSFQNEWRYKVLYIPVGVKRFMNAEYNSQDIPQNIVDAIFSDKHPVIKYVDYNIDEKYFNTLQLIAGPMMDEFTFDELKYFAKGVNQNIIVRRSCLYNKWRSKRS